MNFKFQITKQKINLYHKNKKFKKVKLKQYSKKYNNDAIKRKNRPEKTYKKLKLKIKKLFF